MIESPASYGGTGPCCPLYLRDSRSGAALRHRRVCSFGGCCRPCGGAHLSPARNMAGVRMNAGPNHVCQSFCLSVRHGPRGLVACAFGGARGLRALSPGRAIVASPHAPEGLAALGFVRSRRIASEFDSWLSLQMASYSSLYKQDRCSIGSGSYQFDDQSLSTASASISIRKSGRARACTPMKVLAAGAASP